MSTNLSERELINPFQDEELINFYLQYKGKCYFFEFPVLYDQSFLLKDIKSRTGVRRTFNILFKEKQEEKIHKNKKLQTVKFKSKDETVKSHKEKGKKKNKEFCVHSTNLTTLSLAPYSGQTLFIIDSESSKPCDDPYWFMDPSMRDPVSIYKRKLIKEKFDPFDCPP